MDTLIVEPTQTAQWKTLLLDAQNQCMQFLHEDIESYLVFLLMRYLNNAQIAQSILAVEYMQSVNQVGSLRHDALRDVGDKCLLFAGLFPERAERKRVRVSYFVELGRSAYTTISETKQDNQDSLSDLFSSLSSKFVSMMDVLQATRTLAKDAQTLHPLNAHALWQDTGSPFALENLSRYTKARPIPTPTFKEDSSDPH